MLNKEKFDKYLTQYLNDIIVLRNTFYLYKLIKTDNNCSIEKINKYSNLFITIINSLLDSIILRANKLFNELEQKNINKMIKLCQNNIKYFKDKEEIYLKLKEFQKFISIKSKIINNIKSVRNKYSAHLDRKYFLENNKAFIDYSINNIELEELIEETYNKTKKIYSMFQPIIIDDNTEEIRKDWINIINNTI